MVAGKTKQVHNDPKEKRARRSAENGRKLGTLVFSQTTQTHVRPQTSTADKLNPSTLGCWHFVAMPYFSFKEF